MHFKALLVVALLIPALAVSANESGRGPADCSPEALQAFVQSHVGGSVGAAALGNLANYLHDSARQHAFSPEPAALPVLRQPSSILALPAEAVAETAWVESFQTPGLVRSGPMDFGLLIDAIAHELTGIGQELDQVLGSVTDDQTERLRRVLPTLLDATSSGSDLEDIEHGEILAEIFRSIDMHRLREIASRLNNLAAPGLADALRTSLEGRAAIEVPDWLDGRVHGPILHARQTPMGPIIVGGREANRYHGQALLIIDPAGDDEYLLDPPGRLRVIIDLEGNDRYATLADGGPAGAVLGASLIADHAGNDEYIGGRIALGAAVAGIGMLYDFAGNDRYSAQELAQGASLAGIGVLYDGGGDDLYLAGKWAQGFGGARGTGVLIDQAGDDRYIAGGKHASSYGIPDRYQSFSQGVGMGFRNDIPGGLGLLLDRAGNDEYRAGNFAQGTGYYFGRGVLIDQAGNDRYIGGRYAQGTAAHLGIGVLLDGGGNDEYAAHGPASQGAAWDQAVAVMVDCAGEDRVRSGEFALAAAAQNAVAFALKAAGRLDLEDRRDTRGHVGPNDYHADGSSLGSLAVFFAAADDEPPVIRANPGETGDGSP